MWGGGRVLLGRILQISDGGEALQQRLLVEAAAEAALGSSPNHQSQGNDSRRETLQLNRSSRSFGGGGFRKGPFLDDYEYFLTGRAGR